MWEQVINVVYPAWKSYPVGVGFELHTVESEIWVCESCGHVDIHLR